MMKKLSVAHLGAYHMISSPIPARLYRRSGGRGVVPASEVAMTDWLRVSIRAEAIHPQARAITREALNDIARNSNETVAATAAHLIHVFRIATVDRDRPHADEMSFFSGSTSWKMSSKTSCGDSAP